MSKVETKLKSFLENYLNPITDNSSTPYYKDNFFSPYILTQYDEDAGISNLVEIKIHYYPLFDNYVISAERNGDEYFTATIEGKYEKLLLDTYKELYVPIVKNETLEEKILEDVKEEIIEDDEIALWYDSLSTDDRYTHRVDAHSGPYRSLTEEEKNTVAESYFKTKKPSSEDGIAAKGIKINEEYWVDYYEKVGGHGQLGKTSNNFNDKWKEALKFYQELQDKNEVNEIGYVGVNGTGSNFAVVYIDQNYFNNMSVNDFKNKEAFDVWMFVAKQVLDKGVSKKGTYPDGTFAEKGASINRGLNAVEVIFSNPEYNYMTSVSATTTEEDARKYFVGQRLNMGAYPKEDMQKVVDIKFIPNSELAAKGKKVEERKQINYNKLVGEKDGEYYFLDYIFYDTLHGKDFNRAIGTGVRPISSEDYKYRMSSEGIKEFLNFIDKPSQELISQLRALPEFKDKKEYPTFEVGSGGRVFSKKNDFDKVYNEELLKKIEDVEKAEKGKRIKYKYSKGGYLLGKSHAEGGIEISIPEGMIEAEGGEVIINKDAVKEHCQLLSEINQSVGDGVSFECDKAARGKQMKPRGFKEVYKGKEINRIFPSGNYEFYSDKEQRFIKADDLEFVKSLIDKENNKAVKGKKISTLVRKYDFNDDWEVFDYVINSYINGNFSQVKDLYNEMDSSAKADLFTYLNDEASGESGDEVAEYLNKNVRKFEKGARVRKAKKGKKVSKYNEKLKFYKDVEAILTKKYNLGDIIGDKIDVEMYDQYYGIHSPEYTAKDIASGYAKKGTSIKDSLYKGPNKNKFRNPKERKFEIKNQYEGKTDSEIWNNWTNEQRSHFLGDHNLDGLSVDSYNELPDRTKTVLETHVARGQYKKGGKVKYMQGGKVEDFRKEIASNDLKDHLEKKLKKGDDIIHFAYTDYGGQFLDKVAIEYFIEHHPKNIVWENTAYYGKNAFVFGKPATEWIEASENYPLGFEDIESYYYEKESEAEYESYNQFVDDVLEGKYSFDRDEVISELGEKFGGYFNVTTQGLDYDQDKFISHLEDKGLIAEEAKKGKRIRKESQTKRGLHNDSKFKAKHSGKRTSEQGNTYYEYRQNRSDKDRRTKL